MQDVARTSRSRRTPLRANTSPSSWEIIEGWRTTVRTGRGGPVNGREITRDSGVRSRWTKTEFSSLTISDVVVEELVVVVVEVVVVVVVVVLVRTCRHKDPSAGRGGLGGVSEATG